MKIKFVVLAAFLFCIVTACSARETLSPPEEAYRNFLKACDSGDKSEIETYLTDKAVQAYKNGWLPCEEYLYDGVSSNEYTWVKPDSIEYREWDTDEFENETGEDSGYDGVMEVAELTWFIEGKVDPEGANAPSENTTYISSSYVMMIKINGEWKLRCVWC